jgi:hypothetical protein
MKNTINLGDKWRYKEDVVLIINYEHPNFIVRNYTTKETMCVHHDFFLWKGKQLERGNGQPLPFFEI